MRLVEIEFVGDEDPTTFKVDDWFEPAPRPDGWTVLSLIDKRDVWVWNASVKYISVYDEDE